MRTKCGCGARLELGDRRCKACAAAEIRKARELLALMGRNCMAITCGTCGGSAAVEEWTERPVAGPLPHGTYQCPKCGMAFRREQERASVTASGFVMPGAVRLVPCQAAM